MFHVEQGRGEEDVAERCSLLTPKENQKSVALCGATFCLPAACKDAPLGQRQGGVFRLPPPYLWTPPTPQQAKGCTPLTILKKKSKHKKASAAPVGAIALTLFSLLHQYPLSRCATAPPRGSERSRKPCGLTKNFPAAALQMPLAFTTPSVKIAFGALRRACRGKAPPSANADRSAA